MDTTRWQRIQTLFHQTADLPEADQRSFLKAACDGDDVLVSEVLAMLEADSKGNSLLDRDMANVAQQMLAGQGCIITRRKGIRPVHHQTAAR
jgi:hypothetical protein